MMFGLRGSGGWPVGMLLTAVAPYKKEYIMAPQVEYDPTVTVSDTGTTFESAFSMGPKPISKVFPPVKPPISGGTGMPSTY